MAREKLERKPFGRDGPPSGYPKDQSLYADPENWRYPLHTPWHARAARRYFNDEANRAKYDVDERTYIDWRINEALQRFDKGNKIRLTRAHPSKKPEELSLTELLQSLMNSSRFKRISQIDDSLVSISESTPTHMAGKVKEYVVEMDIANQRISHDCEDWRKIKESKTLCKHLGKFMTMIDEGAAKSLLRDLIQQKDKWDFHSPD